MTAESDYDKQSTRGRDVQRRLGQVKAQDKSLTAFLVNDIMTEDDLGREFRKQFPILTREEIPRVVDLVRDWVLRMAYVKEQFDLAENNDEKAREWLIRKKWLGVIE